MKENGMIRATHTMIGPFFTAADATAHVVFALGLGIGVVKAFVVL
jgi:hypothetical protein